MRKPTLERFCEMCRKHDYFYAMSDSHQVWLHGIQSRRELLEYARALVDGGHATPDELVQRQNDAIRDAGYPEIVHVDLCWKHLPDPPPRDKVA